MAGGWGWVQGKGQGQGQSQPIDAPLFWRRAEHAAHGAWQVFTLHGLVPLDPHTPVTQISYFEVDAYAAWAAAQQQLPLRLPSETEWEHAAEPIAAQAIAAGNFVDAGATSRFAWR